MFHNEALENGTKAFLIQYLLSESFVLDFAFLLHLFLFLNKVFRFDFVIALFVKLSDAISNQQPLAFKG